MPTLSFAHENDLAALKLNHGGQWNHHVPLRLGQRHLGLNEHSGLPFARSVVEKNSGEAGAQLLADQGIQVVDPGVNGVGTECCGDSNRLYLLQLAFMPWVGRILVPKHRSAEVRSAWSNQ